MSKLKSQSTHSLSQHSSSTWKNVHNLPKNRPKETTNLPKAHSNSFPFLYCLSVPMSHKWPRFSSSQIVMTKGKGNSLKGTAFSVATKFLYFHERGEFTESILDLFLFFDKCCQLVKPDGRIDKLAIERVVFRPSTFRQHIFSTASFVHLTKFLFDEESSSKLDSLSLWWPSTFRQLRSLVWQNWFSTKSHRPSWIVCRFDEVTLDKVSWKHWRICTRML